MRSDQLYALLLRIYPASFREEYEREMRADFRRRCREEKGTAGYAFLWLSILADTLLTAGREHLDMLIHDIRYSLRNLRQTPTFTAAVLITVALGIGATTAIYSLVYTVLIRPLPFTDTDRLVRVTETNLGRNIPAFAASVLNFLSWQERSQSFEAVAAIRSGSANLTGDGDPQRALTTAVSGQFWALTGLRPVMGRTFTPEEDKPGNDGVAMLSEGLWQERYGADPAILGRTILLNSQPRVVVGIAPKDVGYTSAVDVWIPLAPILKEESRANHVINVIGKLKPGVTVAAADAELNLVAERLEQEYPQTNAGWRVRLTPVGEWIVDHDSRLSLYVLLGSAGMLLIAACANIAGLLVTRATARAHEFGIRLALGAGSRRLIRQLMTESVLLAVIGGMFGVLIAVQAVAWLGGSVTSQLPRTTNLSVDWPVFAFAFGLTVVVGLLFGIAPAWSARRADVMTTLRSAGRGTTGGSGTLLRLGLIGGQVAVAAILVSGALLLIQSLSRLQKVDLGFGPDHVLTAGIVLPSTKYPTHEKAAAFFDALLAEVGALPGVVSAGLTSGVPMGGNNTSMSVVPIEKSAFGDGDGIKAAFETGAAIQAFWRMATSEYFRTMQVPLRAGRLFDPLDSRLQIVLSEQLARRLWPDGTDPLEREVKLGNGEVLTVVGIVGDVRLHDLRTEPMPTMYFPPFYLSALTLTVRTSGNPQDLAGPLREAVKRADPAQPLFNIRTMDHIVEANAERSRLQTTLLTAFACLALTLGAVGIAGVVAYTVERRALDLAVRLALGATPAQAMRNAASGALKASFMGLVVGLVAALALGQYFSNLLFNVRASDPATLALVALTLGLIALLASWLPARRASRIDPAVTMRQ